MVRCVAVVKFETAVLGKCGSDVHWQFGSLATVRGVWLLLYCGSV